MSALAVQMRLPLSVLLAEDDRFLFTAMHLLQRQNQQQQQ